MENNLSREEAVLKAIQSQQIVEEQKNDHKLPVIHQKTLGVLNTSIQQNRSLKKKGNLQPKTSIFDRKPKLPAVDIACQTQDDQSFDTTNNEKGEEYDEQELEALLLETSKLFQNREFTKATEELYNFKNKFKNLNQRLLFKWNLMMGSCKFEKKELQDATKFYLQCLDLHQNYELGIAMPVIGKICNMLGLIYTTMSEYNLALTVSQTALQIYKQENQVVAFAEVLNNMGMLYFKANMIREAYDFLLEALRIKQEIYGHQSLQTHSTILNLAECLKVMENYQKALSILKYLQQNMRKLASRTEDYKIADLWRRMAQIQHMRGNLNESMELCCKARDLLVQCKCSQTLEYGYLLDTMGLLVLDKSQDRQKAKYYLQEANKLYSIYLTKQNEHRVKLCNNLFLIDHLQDQKLKH